MKPFFTKSKKGYIRVNHRWLPITEIVMLQAWKNYTYMYFNNGQKVLFSKTIKTFDALCTEYGFLRCHRAFIINGNYFLSYSPTNNYVELSYNLKANISRRRKSEVHYFLLLRQNTIC
ncbi:LytR/AlgR family response regulator transcription factor [Flectobacillus major]|uniref:LytR/AlgR family response regulator transcription factor n=1 Tax=Flectobacillus major TaxID=103 RepID=UPI00047A66F7|nr:LytTR family transcriptional regulator DNA-binding domain-containing protein [Flectobacillus major]